MELIVRAVQLLFLNFSKKKLSADEICRRAVLAFTVSLFLPFYVGIAVMSCIAFLTLSRSRAREKALSAPFTKLVFGFLAVSFFASAVYNNYIGMLYSLLAYAVVVCGLYLRSVMTCPLFHLSLDTACVASLWCAAIAVVQKAVYFSKAPNYRPVSVFSNANYYGMMIEFLVVIALYRIFTNPKHRNFYLAVIGVNLIGLYLAASCSACIAMVCAVAIFLFYRGSKKMILLFLAALGAGLVVIVFFPMLLPRSSTALETTIAQRVSIWTASLHAFKRSAIFGRGPSAYRLIWEQYGGFKTYHCHNLLLDALLNYGVAGTIAIFLYAAAQIRVLILRYQYGICRSMDVLAAALLVAVLVHGLSDVTIFWVQTSGLFFLVASSMGIDSAYADERVRLPRPVSEQNSASARLSV
jgi:O-antigen ligase